MTTGNSTNCLRYAAVAVGFSAALAFGPGVAWAAPQESSDTVSSTSAPDAPTVDSNSSEASAENAASSELDVELTDLDAESDVLEEAAEVDAEPELLEAEAGLDPSLLEADPVVDPEADPVTEEAYEDVAAKATTDGDDAGATRGSETAGVQADSLLSTVAAAVDIDASPTPMVDELAESIALDDTATPLATVVENAVPADETHVLLVDVITVREVKPNPVRSVVLGVLGLLGFDPQATGPAPNPIVPVLDAIWGLYRRIETGVANVLDRVGFPAITVTTTHVTTLITMETEQADDLLGAAREIVVGYSEEFDTWYLVDPNRDISIYTAVTAAGSDGLQYPVDPPGDYVIRVAGGQWDPSAVSAQANMLVTYTYYDSTLKHTSYDAAAAPIRVTVVSHILNNAYWDRSDDIFVFGHDFEAALDIVAHEYTHAVIDTVVVGQHGRLLGQDIESQALEEAYADILGSLIEGKQDEQRWLIAEDYGCSSPKPGTGCAIRNIADPASLGGFAHYSQFNSTLRQHRNSTIFSHAAYRMMTDGRTADVSDELWAQVFYQSLYGLSPGASFRQARSAVLSAAQDLGLTDLERQAIVDAFDSVGIIGVDSAAIAV
ncbi:M4 family metallopeptidase [Mycolicibacterium sp. XJ662]